MSETWYLWNYVKEHGTDITDRKCFFDQEALCTLKCPNIQIQMVDETEMEEPRYVARFYCTKFNPPLSMGEREIGRE